MGRVFRPTYLVTLLLICFCGFQQAQAREADVAVLLSREIAPYIATVNGLESALGNRPVQRFFLDGEGVPFSLVGSFNKLEPAQFAAVIAVGPKALRYLSSRHGSTPLLFDMVLNPEHIVPDLSSISCGVTLNLPVKLQFERMSQSFPWLVHLGVLFDPRNNQNWFDQAQVIAAAIGIELVPLQVVASAGRLNVVGNLSRLDALLFIPDKSISSKVVIQYVIKQTVLQRIPAIGYNQFFLDSGAAASFIIDYKQIGRQLGNQLEKQLTDGHCDGLIPPDFTLHVNAEVLNFLRMDASEVTP